MNKNGATGGSKRMLPMAPSICSVPGFCVYRAEGSVCDVPQVNKGNSDAACHRLGNRDLLEMLTPAALAPVDLDAPKISS